MSWIQAQANPSIAKLSKERYSVLQWFDQHWDIRHMYISTWHFDIKDYNEDKVMLSWLKLTRHMHIVKRLSLNQ